MKDSLGTIIYVGKSKNLKNRVGSYFQKSRSHSPKVIKLVQNLKDFDYITTDTEFEAFLLECKLIKEYKPRYNSLMKNPLTYTYLKISKKDNFTDMEVTREVDNRQEALYFGPYTSTSSSTVERAIEGIKVCYKLLCSNSNKKSSSPCLNYSLDLCIGLCIRDEAWEKYSEIIAKLVAMLTGSDRSILNDMKEKMNTASENFDFETAASYRDYIKAVTYLIGQNQVAEYTKENKKIIIAEALDEDLVKVFLVRGNKVLYSESYKLKDYSIDQLICQLKGLISVHFSKGSQDLDIIAAEDMDEGQIIYSYLKKESKDRKHLVLSDKSLNKASLDKELRDLINKLLKIS